MRIYTQLLRYFIGVAASGLILWPAAAVAVSGSPPKETRNIRHIIISLENSRHVWKYQRGTSQADILYEIIAEGHITRILSLFKDVENLNCEIGPVRSVRNYFMPFITDIEGMLLFCGASPSGYGRLQKETSIIGCDEIANSDLFHRRSEIPRPHNLFTDGEQIRQGLAKRNICFVKPEDVPADETDDTDDTDGVTENSPTAEEMWPDQAAATTGKNRQISPEQVKRHNMQLKEKHPAAGKNIVIRYSSAYCVTYKYNEKTGFYYRFINGTPHLDNNCGSQLAPSTVVVATVDAKVMDKKGRLDIDIPAEMAVTIFSKGKTIPGSWSQPGGNSPLPLCDKNDYPFIPPQGQVIFHLISPMVSVSQTNNINFAKKESPIDKFKRLWKGFISGASQRDETLTALVKVRTGLTANELAKADCFVTQYSDDLKVRTILVSSLLSPSTKGRKLAAELLTTFYKSDGYEYIKAPELENKLLSSDQYIKNKALTELADNLEASGIN